MGRTTRSGNTARRKSAGKKQMVAKRPEYMKYPELSHLTKVGDFAVIAIPRDAAKRATALQDAKMRCIEHSKRLTGGKNVYRCVTTRSGIEMWLVGTKGADSLKPVKLPDNDDYEPEIVT